MSKEISKSTITAIDRFGHELIITYAGTDQKELAHFGGLDLHVTATKQMISNTDGLSFPEEQGDMLIREKVAALYLNEVGEFLRNTFFDSNMLDEYSNIELVKNFIDNLHRQPDVLDVIKKDDELIQKEVEEIRREEDEFWSDFMSDIKKK